LLPWGGAALAEKFLAVGKFLAAAKSYADLALIGGLVLSGANYVNDIVSDGTGNNFIVDVFFDGNRERYRIYSNIVMATTIVAGGMSALGAGAAPVVEAADAAAKAAAAKAAAEAAANAETAAVEGAIEGAGKNAIPDATRLTVEEQATAGRLMEKTGLVLRENEHVGAEYIDQFGKTYDAMGTPKASQYWNEKAFIDAIDTHLLKSNDFTVIDLVGFTTEQISVVELYVRSLSIELQSKIIIIK
jgi:hypothetical protein